MNWCETWEGQRDTNKIKQICYEEDYKQASKIEKKIYNKEEFKDVIKEFKKNFAHKKEFNINIDNLKNNEDIYSACNEIRYACDKKLRELRKEAKEKHLY